MKTILFFKSTNPNLGLNSKTIIRVVSRIAQDTDGTYLYRTESAVHDTTDLKNTFSSVEWQTIQDAYAWGKQHWNSVDEFNPDNTFDRVFNMSLQDIKNQFALDMNALGEAKANSLITYDTKGVEDRNFLYKYLAAREERLMQYMRDIRYTGHIDEVSLGKFKQLRKRAVSERTAKVKLDGFSYKGIKYDLLLPDQTDWTSLLSNINAGGYVPVPFPIPNSNETASVLTSLDEIRNCYNVGFQVVNNIKRGDLMLKMQISAKLNHEDVESIEDTR